MEAESYAKSECHAWGSLVPYELPSTVLGVRPASPGYSSLSIRPVTGYLNYAKGEVETPYGMVKVSWKKVNGTLQMSYELPDTMKLAQD